MSDVARRRERRKTAFAPMRAVGCMSGTSLDGVDAAELVTDGETITAFGACEYRPYSEDERAVLRAALGAWPGVDPVAAAAQVVEQAHALVLERFDLPEVIGFHGQTLAHDPSGRGTHQAGDGAALAARLGRRVVWDFRSTDVALGGQGAPLAPAYHFALARYLRAEAPVAFLNLGGVGNLTWIDPAHDRPDMAGAILAFDTGPANAPLDDMMQSRRGQPCDRGGALAATGQVDEAVIARLTAQAYFRRMPPKSLDRNDFAWLGEAVRPLSDADAAATLTAAVAASVVLGFEHFEIPPQQLWVTGGGRRNRVLMAMLAAGLPCPVAPVEEAGLDGDMLEAQAFAFLAVRVLRGLPTSFPATTGVPAAVGGGEVSYPDPGR